MKTKHIIMLLGLLATMSIANAEEQKAKVEKKAISPEILEKYDTDKDGKLSKEEKAAMKADKKKEAKKEAKPKKKKKPKKEKEAEEESVEG